MSFLLSTEVPIHAWNIDYFNAHKHECMPYSQSQINMFLWFLL